MEPIDFRHTESPEQNAAFLAAAKRVRLCVRLAGLLSVLIAWYWGGRAWAWGAWLGAFLVELNMAILWRFLKRAHQWRGSGLRPTLFRFYLFFGATAIFCFLVIRNSWGHPVGFLLGLLSFMLGFFAALLTLAARPAKAD